MPSPNPVTRATLSLRATETPHHSESVESPEMTPPNPQSQGLGSSGYTPLGDASEEMPQEIHHQRAHRVADTLASNPDFIKAGFHIGNFITAGVDKEKEHAVTEALKCNMEFAS
jgi:hypothetical protein